MRRATVAALAVLALAALLAAPAAESAARGGSPWQLFPGAKVDLGRPVLGLGWAAGRIWAVTPSRDVPVAWSARASGGRLTSFASARAPGDAGRLIPIVAGELVVVSNDRITTAPLLGNGRIGVPRDVPDDLVAGGKEAVPKLATVEVQSAVQIGGRTVWALLGYPDCHSIGGCPGYFLVCCSENGGAVDLTRFVDRRVLASDTQVGTDSRGRLWLGWLDRRDYSRAQRGYPRMLELDPATLAPRSKAVAAPGLVADKVVLACAASCRLVAQSATGDIVSWASGERSPTRVASHWERGRFGDSPMFLLDASYRSGRLLVGYWGTVGKTIYADKSVRTDISVARGDSRGATSKVIGTIPVANNWPPQNPSAIPTGPVVYGKLTPSGLVVVEIFQYTRGNYSPLAAAVVPSGR